MAEIAKLHPPEAISTAHDVTGFSCGRNDLDDWLRRHALANEGKASRTYVVCAGNRVIAYYTLAAGAVTRDALPRRVRHGNPEQVPVVVLGRLAVDRRFVGQGIGRAMLQEAILRALRSAQEIGVRALLVHAIDEEAARFYLKYGFLRSPFDELTLMLLIETARDAVLS